MWSQDQYDNFVLVGDTVAEVRYRNSDNQQFDFLLTLLSKFQNRKFDIPDYLEYDLDFLGFFSWISWANTETFREVLDLPSVEHFFSAVRNLDSLRPKILAISEVEFPRGGGEANLKEWLDFANVLGFKCSYLSFRDFRNNPHKVEHYGSTQTFLSIKSIQEVDLSSFIYYVEKTRPDFVITQGGINKFAQQIADSAQIPIISVYNFWNGLVDLGPTGNISIKKNIDQHSLSKYAKSHPLVTRILVSEFMLTIYKMLGGEDNVQVVEPFLDRIERFADQPFDLRSGVLAINLHPLKSGKVFLELTKKLRETIPLIGIDNEPFDIDTAFRREIEQLTMSKSENVRIHSYRDLKELYRGVKLVIVPSAVDETFCRVALEAVLNGAVVLSTSNGNLPNILGPESLYLSPEPGAWVSLIDKIYDDSAFLESVAQKQFDFVAKNFKWNGEKLLAIFLETLAISRKKEIAIFTVWAEQGLGIQSKLYSKILMKLGLKVHIFAFKPYLNVISDFQPDKNRQDWEAGKNCTSLFYSEFDRENVPVQELIEFLEKNNVSKLIVPEVCWDENWNRLEILKASMQLQIYIVPNSETVRFSELTRHKVADKLLAPTKLMQNLADKYNLKNSYFIGNAKSTIEVDSLEVFEKHFQTQPSMIKYVHIAGHNPETRKQTKKIIRAFIMALKIRNDICLLITTNKPLSLFDDLTLPTNIKILSGNFSNNFIESLYQEAHVSIQVSSHEGIGLGFYESIACNTPIISLNCPPHNEIVIPGLTGWLLDCLPIQLPDNAEGVVPAWTFHTEELFQLISSLSLLEVKSTGKKLIAFQSEVNDEKYLKYRLAGALFSTEIDKIDIAKVITNLFVAVLILPLYLLMLGILPLTKKIKYFLTKDSKIDNSLASNRMRYSVYCTLRASYKFFLKGNLPTVKFYFSLLIKAMRRQKNENF